MKILYICSLFCQKNSSAAIRNMSLVDGLIKIGHKVHVITLSVNSEDENKLYKQINCKYTFLGNSQENQSTIKNKSLKSNKFLLKAFNIIRPLLFFPDTHKRFINLLNPKLKDDFDIIISSSDTKSSHFAAEKVKEYFALKKWVQIWGDPWMADVTLDSFTKLRIKDKEKKLLYKADQVLYISEITKDLMKKTYPEYIDKIGFIPRSYYRKIYNNNISTTNLRFLYTGVISHGRNIEVFFDWFSTTFCVNGSKLDIYGYVSENMKLDFSKYSNINFKGTKNYEDILVEYETTDVLVLLGNAEGSTQIPGKLYDYLGTNLPILCIMHSKDESVSKLLAGYEQCFVMTYDELILNSINVEELKNFINKRYEPIERFSSENVASTLIENII